MASAQRRRGRLLDPDVDERARIGRAGEVHRRVAAGAAAQHRLVGARRALDEHLLDEADTSGVAGGRDPLGQLDEPFHPLDLQLVRDLLVHRRRLRALAR